MSTKQLSPRKLRERKFLLRAPFLAVPLLTGLFWFYGGGQPLATERPATQGFNTSLPHPHLVQHLQWQKLDYYLKAAADSAAAAQKERAGDSYAKKILGDSIEGKVKGQLAELQKKVEATRTLATAPRPADPYPGVHRKPPVADNPDIERLERMMGLLKRDKEGDPEIRELSEVVEKLYDSRRPNAGKDTAALPGSRERTVLSMRKAPPLEGITGLDSGHGKGAGFFGLGSSDGVPFEDQGLAAAIVTDTRQVAKGSTIRLELLTEIRVGPVTIPRGEFLYGTCGNPGAERLPVTVTMILFNRESFPVNIRILGSDGLPGLPIPGSFSREALRESAAQGIGSIGPATIDPSVGAQAASAGIQVARSLAGRKVRAETARVEAGVRVFLQDNK